LASFYGHSRHLSLSIFSEKIHLLKALDKMRHELDDTRGKCEELRSARQEAVRELLTIQETHRAELRIINNSLQEETSTRESLERRLSELRGELERLQTENSTYWSRLERTETEKINLERENKKMKAELIDGQVSGRLPSWSSGGGSRSEEFRMIQQELVEKNKVSGAAAFIMNDITDDNYRQR
jgi:coiled-coil domain-containing protein 102A